MPFELPSLFGMSMSRRHGLMIRSVWILSALAFSGGVAAAETVTYIHSDPNGSPYLATNAAGAISWQEEYRPFGDRLTREADPFGNRVWFAGQPEAVSAAISRMGVRHYNPEIGRFYGVDPVAFDPTQPQTINPYQYANNNPYRFVDADGRNAVTAFGGVLNESWSFLNGEGFNYERIGSALADGYDGEGDGVIAAATEDALFFVGGPASSLVTKGAVRLYQGWRAGRGATFVDDVVPGLLGSQSVGAAQLVRTLQTGGNTVLRQTARALNDALGRSVARRDWGRALEGLKKELSLPRNHHGAIRSNGDYADEAGNILGSLLDYLP